MEYGLDGCCDGFVSVRESVDLERGFGETLDDDRDGVGEGGVHRLRLCGDRVDNAVGCGFELCLQGCGNMAVRENLQERSGAVHV